MRRLPDGKVVFDVDDPREQQMGRLFGRVMIVAIGLVCVVGLVSLIWDIATSEDLPGEVKAYWSERKGLVLITGALLLGAIVKQTRRLMKR